MLDPVCRSSVIIQRVFFEECAGTSVQDSQGGLTTYVYDALNRLTSEKFTQNGSQALRMVSPFPK